MVIDRLGLSPTAFLRHMLVPGLVAAVGCAAVVAVLERRALAPALAHTGRARTPLVPAERRAGIALLAAGLAAWTALLLGVALWWPFAAAVGLTLALGRRRSRVVVPWRIGAQVGGLLVVTEALNVPVPTGAGVGLLALLALAAGVGLAAAVANNLPVSVVVAGPPVAGPSA